MDKRILCAIAGGIALLGCLGVMTYTMITAPANCGSEDGGRIIYIDRDDTADSVRAKSALGWRWDCYGTLMSYKIRTGRYRVTPGTTCLGLYRQLRNGTQEPMRLVIPTARTMQQLAARLAPSLMVDSAEIASALTDSIYCADRGYTLATIPALIIPDTYEVYWDTSVDKLVDRLVREHDRFWNDERKAKAKAVGLKEEEVATLASIVDSETANNDEKPMIAGLYLNRLHTGMPLQADPTVVFAVGDFSIRRVLNIHLQTDSPYNTYRYAGLPPGPIRVASIAGLDAVLNHAKHNYLYMCAKEDFSGTHNFAATYPEHLKNARKYTKALNARGIK